MSSNEDYDNSIPEEQGSSAEDFTQEPVEDDEFDGFEMPEMETVKNLKCPVCGNRGMFRYALSNNTKDRRVIFECIKCGSTPPSYSELSDIQR